MKQEVAEAIPRVGLAGIAIFGSWTLQDVSMVGAIAVSIAGLIYTVINTAHLLWRWRQEWKEKRRVNS